MSEVPEPELIKKTQGSLSKFIKEPPLTEKLLRKPPFRFLQDIIKSIVKETGYLREVFTDEELLDNAKDKEKKIAFLKKVISSIQATTGNAISVKPNKIVAGLEVPKTLELLQLLGSAITLQKSGETGKQPDPSKSTESVKIIAAHNGSPSSKTEKTSKSRSKKESVINDSSPASANKETKKKIEKSGKTEKPKSKDDEKVKEKTFKTGEEEVKSRDRPVSRRKSIQEQQLAATQIITPSDPPGKTGTSDSTSDITVPNGPTQSDQADEAKPEGPEIESTDKVAIETKLSEEKVEAERRTSARRASSKARPPSSKTREKSSPVKAIQKEKQVPAPILGTDDAPVAVPKVERPKTARKAPPSCRPTSSRPSGVPKMKDRGEVKTDLNQTNETEAKPVAVIADSEVTQDEENLVVIESQPLPLDVIAQDLSQPELFVENGEPSEGALVAQILETKKEMDENKQIWASIGGAGIGSAQQKVEIDWEGGRKHKKEAWSKEMNRLRDGIQQLTRSANPLGKLFDFLQEDVDSMQRELKMWTDANSNYRGQLEHERRLSDESLESYRRKLAELDNLIEEEQEAVRTIRASVLANDKRLMSLLSRSE